MEDSSETKKSCSAEVSWYMKTCTTAVNVKKKGNVITGNRKTTKQHEYHVTDENYTFIIDLIPRHYILLNMLAYLIYHFIIHFQGKQGDILMDSGKQYHLWECNDFGVNFRISGRARASLVLHVLLYLSSPRMFKPSRRVFWGCITVVIVYV